MQEVVVEVKNLIKTYGDFKAVDEISFEIQKGEVFAFLGPNGAGKTTTVEILECLKPLTGGSAKVLGHDVSKESDAHEIRKKIGVLPQDFNALDKLTVKENIDLFGEMYDKRVKTEELLKLLDLTDKSKTRFENLSGGLKQRVGMAASLVNNPDLVFLDEPTTGLDPQARRDVWKIIRNLKNLGKTVFLTTHYMEEAQVLADKIAIINPGKITATGTPQELIEQYGGKKSLIIRKGNKQVADLLKTDFSDVTLNEDGDVTVNVDSIKDIWQAVSVLAKHGVERDVETVTPTINDVFLTVVGGKIKEGGELE